MKRLLIIFLLPVLALMSGCGQGANDSEAELDVEPLPETIVHDGVELPSHVVERIMNSDMSDAEKSAALDQVIAANRR